MHIKPKCTERTSDLMRSDLLKSAHSPQMRIAVDGMNAVDTSILLVDSYYDDCIRKSIILE